MSCAVLQHIAEMSEPVTFSGTAWDFLSASVNVRRLTDIDLFIESLEGEFTAEQLREAKIMSLNNQGESLPTPVVSELMQTFVCLRCNKEENPFDFLTGLGSLMSDEPPCFTARLDWHTKLCAEKSKGQLFVVTDVRSLALFRLLSLPATLVSGLDDINGEQMRRLCGQPGVESSQQTDCVRRHNTLTLVGWDVPNICVEESGRMATTALRLARIAESFDFSTENIRFWEPTTRALQQITFAVELRDDKLVRKAVRSSLEESSRSLQTYAEEIARPKDFVGIQHELVNEIKRARKWRHATSELSRKRQMYDEVFHETYVMPLYLAAQSSLDPAASSLLLAMAEISEQLHRSTALVRVAAHAGSRDDDPHRDPIGPIESKARLQLVNQLVEIRRELRGRK